MSDKVREALVAEIVRAVDAWCYNENGDETCDLDVEGRKWRVRTPFGGDDNLIEIECDDLDSDEGLRVFTIEVKEVKGD